MKARTLLFATLTLGRVAQAQEPLPASSTQPEKPDAEPLSLAADRPGFATGTSIVARGHIQLELGATASRPGAAREYSFAEALVRVPVARRVEVRLALPSYLLDRAGQEHEDGADDLGVGAKLLLASTKRATYALLVNAALPTGSRRVAEHRFQPGGVLAADLTLSRHIGMTLNLGSSRASEEGQRFTQVLGASSLNFALSPKLGLFSEVYAFNAASGPTQKYLDGGFTYLLRPRIQLDASGGVGLGNHVGGPDFFYSAGMVHLF